MKILLLNAHNINSLRGKTQIDFESIGKRSGLFAITGATGSGKSTILDIISCALYGQTPRLKNPNELMSRHTAEALCEVEFVVGEKRYRSSWSQRRAHKKPDGKFQTPKMELVDLTTGKIISNKSKDVPKQIASITGLDFERFCQSMLLAQGGFDAFLKANEKERSVLLEKITQTQIYADISIKVFEKHKALQSELEQKRQELEGIALLTQEQLQEKEQLLSYATTQKERAQQDYKKTQEDFGYFKKLQELQTKQSSYKVALEEVQKSYETHKEEFVKLKNATLAKNVEPLWKSVQQLALFQTKTQQQLLKEQTTAKQLEKEIASKELLLQERFKKFQEQKAHSLQEEKKIAAFKELLSQEAHSIQNLKSLEKKRQTKEQQHQKTLKEKEHLVTQEKVLQTQKQTIEKELATLETKEPLFAHLAVLEHLFISQEQKQKQCQSFQKELQSLDIKVLEETKAQLQTKLQELQKTQEEKENILQSLQTLLEEEAWLQKRHQELQNALEAYTKKRTLLQEQDEVLLKLKELKKELQQLQEKITLLEEHLQTLYQQKEQKELIAKYEADRAKLKEGEACFLCGATTHPYAKEKPKLDLQALEEQIAKKQQQLKEKQTLLTQHEQTKFTLELQLTQLQKQLHEIEGSAKDTTKELEEVTQKLQTLEQTKEQKKQLLNELTTLKQNLNNTNKAYQEATITLQNALYTQESLQKRLQEETKNQEELHQQKEELFTKLQYRVEFSQLPLLQEQKERFEMLKQQLQVLGQEELQLQKAQEKLLAALKEQEETLQEITKEQGGLQETLTKIAQEKVALLNVADIAKYEEELQQQLQHAQEAYEKLSLELQNKKGEHRQLTHTITTLEQQLQHTTQELQQHQEALEVELSKHNFSDTAALEVALLDEVAFLALQEKCDAITQKLKQTQTLFEATTKELEMLQHNPPTTYTPQELQTLEVWLNFKIETLQTLLVTLQQELQNHYQNATHFLEQTKELEKIEAEFAIWTKLNELIGSADGAKFKKIAQSITLDWLLYLANQHLMVLNKRYLLVRDQNKQLQLNVIDQYQGNVVRSVATLSGGESFIVSLALALGLSSLASQRISIDSLFLDEGFGTLDEESLEVALDALSRLQNSGKMVGIISHVKALKERIPVQIQVISKGDGVSSVEVVG